MCVEDGTVRAQIPHRARGEVAAIELVGSAVGQRGERRREGGLPKFVTGLQHASARPEQPVEVRRPVQVDVLGFGEVRAE